MLFFIPGDAEHQQGCTEQPFSGGKPPQFSQQQRVRLSLQVVGGETRAVLYLKPTKSVNGGGMVVIPAVQKREDSG